MTGYKARRLPRHRGPAAWAEILGEGPKYGPLDGEVTADVAVIGAGFAGLSAARRVQQLDPKARVIVLEAGRLAEGAAGRNSGFMIDLPHDLASDDYAGKGSEADRKVIGLNRRAIGFGREAVEEYGIDPAFFDPSGKVNGAASAKGHAHNESYARHLEGLGEEARMLDAREMEELTGSQHYRSGLFTPGTVMLQPAGYIRGLGKGLSRRVRICEESPVLGFQRVGADWRVRCEKGLVTAGKVILACNGHLESFGIAKGRLMQLFLYASMTCDLGGERSSRLGGASRWGITPSDPMGTTMRRIDAAQGGVRIITRTAATLRPGMVPSHADLTRAGRIHRKKFDARFPNLKDIPMEHVWAGHLCLSLNGVAHAREIEEGVYSACVQNGLGTARGTLTGIAAAERACGVQSDVTAYFDGEAEPKPLPPQPFASLGANAYLRWKEWRAGAE